uniref:Phage protein n=1 Tax=Mammaliicoccus phage MSShimriz1 TaxID=3230127 RepID=A0AAU8GSA5_9VIRU
MNKVTIMKDLLKRLEESGVEDIVLELDVDGDIRVADLEIIFTEMGTQATIYHDKGTVSVEFIGELTQEIMTLLNVSKWEAGREVKRGSAVRTLVYSHHNHYSLLDAKYFDLEYESAYTVKELKEKGWELVK